ncbi:glycosyltransferase family 39 protein [Tardiphaga sp. OK246]|uniref:ArnT family glycosyltransferase n=1 Tax=Tardiphaga sp. OK246 TaxID=1855307 RepID=UPI0015952E60|nr:glycosyltransferase family 39 protein [Tardiphaga sp. OK246]
MTSASRSCVVATTGTILVLMLPTVLWIFNDLTVWPWDQAWYGQVTMALANSVPHGADRWMRTMISAMPSKPPLLPWLAQVSVPFSDLVGSPERAFLLVNACISAATLAVVFSTVMRLSAGVLAAIAAVLACGGASLFIGMSHEFVVEPLQALLIAVLMRISLDADVVPLRRLLAGLVIVVALAMLAKTTSAGFILPFLFYIVLVKLVVDRPLPQPFTFADLVLFAAALGAAGAALLVYVANWNEMVGHFRNATSAEIAIQYGSIGAFGPKIKFWFVALLQAVSPWTLPLGVAMIAIPVALVAAAARTLGVPPRQWLFSAVQSRTLFAFCLFGTLSAGLVSYANQINEETRFLNPMLPILSVSFSFTLKQFGSRWLSFAAIAFFAANAIAGHLHALGLIDLGPTRSVWLKSYRIETASVDRLSKAVALTCDHSRPPRYNIVGVELPDFNANSAAFYGEKLRPRGPYECYYTSLGYAEKNVDTAIKRIADLNAQYFITLPHALIPSVETNFLNIVDRPAADWVSSSDQFQRVTESGDQVVVYRRGP